MASCEPEFEKSFPVSTSRQRLFWEQQMSFAKKERQSRDALAPHDHSLVSLPSTKVRNSRGMRWHPMIIRWCLYLRQKSETAYDVFSRNWICKFAINKDII
ncbi:hypothetical protein DPMN_161217 [Dreissena polymorpha]|uniref:Uncharacterized protein n=1 Tax=Dreissena polymorpha TaxID=45954 RepID=A0A9D4EN29_DREPO|nr:hypothetical protein DPMN_161217 [Dreissena polymorpha]